MRPGLAATTLLLFTASLLALAPHVRAASPPDKSVRASAAFGKGQRLYAAGEFEKALAAFRAANAIAPHLATLFNIGRCQENLGRFAAALATFKEVLAQEKDATKRAQLQRRIRSLERRPTKVFVTSRPPGAAITVDGRDKAERGVTPLVTALPPGEHVLVLRLAGHKPSIRRVVVEVGKEQTVAVTLAPERGGQPCTAARCKPCPAVAPAPPPLVRDEGLHLHASLALSLGLSADRGVDSGPAALLHMTLGRLMCGL